MKRTVTSKLKTIRSETERPRWEEDVVATVNEVHSQVSDIGGVLTVMINKTGAPSVKGTVITASPNYDNSFEVQVHEYEAVGIVYDDGIPDGDYCRVVVCGVAEVLLKDGTATAPGNWVKSADTDGRAEATTPPASIGAIAANEHFKEIGHSLETKTAGTDVLCRVVLHFN